MEGKTIFNKWTDCGGTIKNFKTIEEAEVRCEYLVEYDNTILYLEPYTIIGILVIRVSYILTNEQQYYITDLIVDAFTKQ